ncbi:MAG: hypothetical protein JWN03_4689, partial [Nocardia sp.]|nr:hypothetical protein [Nocardia sp.]
MPDHHNHTGLFTPPLGRCSTVNWMTVPSRIGIGPAQCAHA